MTSTSQHPIANAARRQLHHLVPIVAVGLVVTMLLLCVLCTKLGGQYTGGLAWPYLGDLVRDAPAYYVCALGALPAAVLLALAMRFNFAFQSAMLADPSDAFAVPLAATRLLRTCIAAGTLAALALVLLALCSDASYPTMHSVAGHAVLLLASVAVVLNTCLSYKIQRGIGLRTDHRSYTLDGVTPAPPSPEVMRLQKLQRTFYVQLSCAAAFAVALLLLGPVGLAVAERPQRLTIPKCLALAFGTDYCTRTMALGDGDTKLWSYEDDVAAHQMRAIAQLVCVMSLLSYILTFATHAYEAALEKVAKRQDLAQSTHFYSLAVLPTPPPPTAAAALDVFTVQQTPFGPRAFAT